MHNCYLSSFVSFHVHAPYATIAQYRPLYFLPKQSCRSKLDIHIVFHYKKISGVWVLFAFWAPKPHSCFVMLFLVPWLWFFVLIFTLSVINGESTSLVQNFLEVRSLALYRFSHSWRDFLRLLAQFEFLRVRIDALVYTIWYHDVTRFNWFYWLSTNRCWLLCMHWNYRISVI